jgi:gas vesicle protein
MKKFLGILMIAGTLVACNDSATTTGDKKDSIQDNADSLKNKVENKSDSLQDHIQNTADSLKDKVEQKDSLSK